MKPKTDPRIDTYIAEASEFAQPILKHARAVIRAECPTVEETIKWSQPAYMVDGKILCITPAFKAHCRFVFWQTELRKKAGLGDEADDAFDRLTEMTDLPSDATIRRVIRATLAFNASGGAASPKRASKPKPPAAVPPDLAAALKKNKAAAKAFENFSPSHRREYIEWITEAKRDETRQKRLTTTLEWLVEGKSRNWKYMNC